MASYQPVKYIEGGTDTPASQATAKLIAALRATKKLVFEVIRLPDTDVPVVDGDMKDLDMLRRCIVHSDRYYKSKQALRLSTNLSKAQKMHRDTLHQIERAIEEEKAAFKHDQKNLFIGEDDDAESKTVALADAPLRPCKTASAKQTLTEADFPLTGRYLADDISVKVGYQEINVRQWLTDSRAQKFGPGMGKLKLYEKVSIPRLYRKAQTCELIAEYMRRRLLALVDRKANKISKKMLQLVLDDAISFLRSSGRIQPELVSRDIITAEWLVRRDPSDAKPAKKLDTLSIQYRVVAGMGPSYIHRSITDTYRNGFGSCIVSLKYTPQDEPPAGDFPEFVPLTWGKKSKLDWLDDEDEEAVKNGYTIADHRRTIRWLEYIVNAVYSMNLPQGWTVMDVFERAQAFDTGGASQTRLELMTTMIGRRPGYLPPTTPMGVARHFGATRAYLFVKTSYKFASDDKGVSPFSLLSAKSGRWLTGINFDLDEEVMDTIKHTAVSTFAETGGDLFATLDVSAWTASVFEQEQAVELYRGDVRSFKCDGSNQEVHVTRCCSKPTICSDLVKDGTDGVCSGCGQVLAWPKGQGGLPSGIAAKLKRVYNIDRALQLSGVAATFMVQAPGALAAGVKTRLDAPLDAHPLQAEPDANNPLLRRTVMAVWPVSTVDGNVGTNSKTAMTFADNFAPTLSYAPRVAWVHSVSSTQPVLENMAAYHSSTAEAKSTFRALRLREDVNASVPFLENAAAANAFNEQQAKVAAERKFQFSRRGRAKMKPNAVKDVIASVEGATGTGGAATAAMSAGLQRAVRVGDDDTRRLRKVVEEMAEAIAREKKTPVLVLPQGPTGLPSPFTGEDNSRWTYSLMKSTFTRLLHRTRTSCNRHHVLDGNSSFETHYLNACRSVLLGEGVCDLIGMPFTSKPRSHTRLSMGHVEHGKNMASGWSSPRPTSYSQYSKENGNIKAESWSANYLKSDFPLGDIQACIAHLAGDLAGDMVGDVAGDLASGGPSGGPSGGQLASVAAESVSSGSDTSPPRKKHKSAKGSRMEPIVLSDSE